MSGFVHISEAMLKEMYSESGFLEVETCVFDAIFGSDTGYEFVASVQKFQNFGE